jgi:hypothetical protein
MCTVPLLLMAQVNSELVDVFTLHNENKIHCLTSNEKIAMYVLPPVDEDPKQQLTLLSAKDWNKDSWVMTDSNHSFQAHVTDKRWEYFGIDKTDYLRFSLNKSLSLSLFSSIEIEVFVDDGENLDYTKLWLRDEEWNHISIILQNNNLVYLLNDEVIKRVVNFSPRELVVKLQSPTFFKIHNYKFMQSDKVTNEKPMTLTVPPKKSCLLLYITLCAKCTLNIPEVNGYYGATSSQASDIHFWQVYKLELKSDHENVLTFYKERADNATIGFWGIDVQDCPKIADNIVSYVVNVPGAEANNYTCEILNEKYKKNRTTRMNPNIEKFTFGCNPGEFGSNCEMKCRNILGDKYEYCQAHRLCQNENCMCAWGYTGPSCNICQSEKLNICKNYTTLTHWTNKLFTSTSSILGGLMVIGTILFYSIIMLAMLIVFIGPVVVKRFIKKILYTPSESSPSLL